MPVCTECKERMEVNVTIAEKEKGLNLTCPKCGSKKMVQVFGSFMVMGSSRGNKPPICGPNAGPSCCG